MYPVSLDIAVGDIDRDEILFELLLSPTERDLMLNGLKRSFFNAGVMTYSANSMVSL